MNITSPLITGGEVNLIHSINTEYIISLYQSKYEIDTKRFFEGLSKVDIFKCATTGYEFGYPYSVAGDGKFYEELQNFEWYYTADKWEHLESLKYINKGDNVLEVGCAKGAFLERLKTHCAKAVGLELNESAAENARAKGLDVRNQLIQDFAKANEGQFDVVCSYQVLEHITEVREVINAMIACLKPGGRLIISVPNNETFITLDDLNMPPHHVGFWNSKAFKALPKYFTGIKLREMRYEPLQSQHFEWYYDIKFRQPLNKLGFIGYKLLGLLFPYKDKLLHTLSSKIKGHSIMPIYYKL